MILNASGASPNMDAEVINDTTPEAPEVEPVEAADDAYVEDATDAPEDNVGHFWKVAEEALGGVKDNELPGYVKDLTPSHLDELPTVAKQIIRDAMVAKQRAEAQAKLAASDAEARIAKQREAVEEQERAFARRQASFAALVDSPEVRKLLEVPEGKLPDPYTPEGMEARIKRETARTVQTFFEPIPREAEMRAKESAYMDFVAAHPEMRDPQFKAEVNALLVERRDAGSPMVTPDAYEIIKGRRAAAEAQLKRNREIAARRASAEKVGRTSAGSSPSSDPIPQAVLKRGAAAVAEFLENNPSAMAAVRRQYGR